MEDRKALLVIDMQKGSFTPKTPRYDAKGVVQRINELAQVFRKLNYPVIYIQHDGTGTGAFEKNTPNWEILDDLSVALSDIRIDKYANDVFYKSQLHSKLKELKVGEVFITGCATDFCIESTIQSALTKDYNITVVADGHTTGERPHLKAAQVIEHYNWVWQNMIPTKGKIQVQKTARIMSLILPIIPNDK
ncbi:MAG: nicotinamidase-related amidase [Maribacter sp.]|jgi:nicotinamidase-related amidase